MNRLEEMRLRRENYVLLREDFDELLDLAEAVDVWYRAFENNEVTESDAWEDMSDALGRVREDVPA